MYCRFAGRSPVTVQLILSATYGQREHVTVLDEDAAQQDICGTSSRGVRSGISAPRDVRDLMSS